MKRSLISLSILCGALAASGAALADHNSKNGEGWANMPNDIHNTRIETRTVPAQAMKQQGQAQQVQNKAENKAMNRNMVETGVKSKDRTRTESRSRIHRDSSMTSQRSRSAANNRSSGRKGGKR